MKNLMIIIFLSIVWIGCESVDYKNKSTITIGNNPVLVNIEKTIYKTGETVRIKISGKDAYAVILKDLSITGEPVIKKTNRSELEWEIGKDTPFHAIGVFVEDKDKTLHYASYFRITGKDQLTCYHIGKEEYRGLDIFRLNGGMSAEYAIQKSLSSLAPGVSHTWEIGPGGGPSPVWGTPDFLEKSIQYTVELYNQALGENTPVENVIISTGTPNIPYFSATMKAPVLPIHFLVSVNSCKEIQSILDYSGSNGYPAYATLGYDASMANVGVAWIKILELPEAYKKFIQDHQVRNIIIAGVDENVHSESYARRVLNHSEPEEYACGSFYIQYTNHGSEKDINTLKNHLIDYNSQELDTVRMIADWESGILNKQINKISAQANEIPGVQSYVLRTPGSMAKMYDLSTYMSLEFIHKNDSLIPSENIQGITLNEYLISEPVYEILNRNVPLVYWQFNPPASTIDRIDKDIIKAIQTYYPGVDPSKLAYHLNARVGKKELAGELEKRGYKNISMRLDNIEEVWDLSDGINAPCEFVAEDIIKLYGNSTNYKDKVSGLQALSVDDLEKLGNNISGISFKRLTE